MSSNNVPTHSDARSREKIKLPNPERQKKSRLAQTESSEPGPTPVVATVVCSSENKDVEQLKSEIVHLNEQLNSYRDHSKCMICFEKVVAPLLYPCNQHVGCHSCIWGDFNANKGYSAGLEYVSKLSCPCCRDSADTISLTTKMPELYEPEALALRLMDVNLDQQVQCPYCEYTESMNHIYQCQSRTLNCHKCGSPLSYLYPGNVKNHLSFVCDGFRCSECPGEKMNEVVHIQHMYVDELRDIIARPQRLSIHRNIITLAQRHRIPDPDRLEDCNKYIYQMSIIRNALANIHVNYQLLTDTSEHTILTAITVLSYHLSNLQKNLKYARSSANRRGSASQK